MRFTQYLFAAFTLGAAMTSVAAAEDVPRLPDQPHIVVVGHGSAEADADFLEIDIGVDVRGDESSKALADVKELLGGVVAALLELDIEEDDIAVNAPYVREDYDYDESGEVVHFVEASRSISLTLRTMDDYEDMVRTAAEHGATRIGEPTERSDQEAELSTKARQRAIEHAHRRAEELAAGFNRSRGPVYAVATSEARYWRSTISGYGGGIFGDAGREEEVTLTYTPAPVEREVYVYAVFLLGEELETE